MATVPSVLSIINSHSSFSSIALQSCAQAVTRGRDHSKTLNYTLVETSNTNESKTQNGNTIAQRTLLQTSLSTSVMKKKGINFHLLTTQRRGYPRTSRRLR